MSLHLPANCSPLLDSNLIRNIIVISIIWTFFFVVSKLVKFLVRNQYSQKKLLYFVKRYNGGYLKSNTIEFSSSKVNSHLFLSENSYHLKCCSVCRSTFFFMTFFGNFIFCQLGIMSLQKTQKCPSTSSLPI